MKKVTMYIKPACPFCKKALLILNRVSAKPTVIDITNNATKKQEMVVKSNGGNTVPQIFFGDEHIGGCDNLVKLEKRGQLEQKLNK